MWSIEGLREESEWCLRRTLDDYFEAVRRWDGLDIFRGRFELFGSRIDSLVKRAEKRFIGMSKYAFEGSKYLRPAFFIETVDTLRGWRRDPLYYRVAGMIQAWHEMSLIFDDIIDMDEVRRGRSALWVKEGTAPALLLATYLLGLAAWVSSLYPSVGVAFHRAVGAAYYGELMDVEGASANSLADWLAVTSLKTGVLFLASFDLALAVTGRTASNDERRAAASAGYLLQLTDDIEDYYIKGERGGNLVHTYGFEATYRLWRENYERLGLLEKYAPVTVKALRDWARKTVEEARAGGEGAGN